MVHQPAGSNLTSHPASSVSENLAGFQEGKTALPALHLPYQPCTASSPDPPDRERSVQSP